LVAGSDFSRELAGRAEYRGHALVALVRGSPEHVRAAAGDDLDPVLVAELDCFRGRASWSHPVDPHARDAGCSAVVSTMVGAAFGGVTITTPSTPPEIALTEA
jgi:hypothetical protein